MPNYRLYFLGPHGDFVGRRTFEASDDAAARDAARCIYRRVRTPHHGYEIWRERRRLDVASENRAASDLAFPEVRPLVGNPARSRRG